MIFLFLKKKKQTNKQKGRQRSTRRVPRPSAMHRPSGPGHDGTGLGRPGRWSAGGE